VNSRVIFTAEKTFDSETLRQYSDSLMFSDTAKLSNGTVLANRKVAHFHSILPNGGNFTINFEMYDADGTQEWGPNIINITYVFRSENLKRSPIGEDHIYRMFFSFSLVTNLFDSNVGLGCEKS
jgi:hypothetical protein